MEKLLLKPMDAAELIEVGRSRIYEMLQKGELPSVRIGRSVRVPVSALRQWVEEQGKQTA
ncbi:MAG: helix-turn-helix domain-containing protein [Chloroflexi bacterium]|nr:helix-turn-helix domain-containing protein [Chloroflexota bacterium]